MDRQKQIYKVTLAGGAVNVILLIFKFVAGILGHSAAMIADAVHSLSDFITDLIVLIFVHISGRPQDKSHDYGHGKYETLALTLIGIALLIVAKIVRFATFVFAIAQKRWKIALLLALTVVVCFVIILAWINVGMKISGW